LSGKRSDVDKPRNRWRWKSVTAEYAKASHFKTGLGEHYIQHCPPKNLGMISGKKYYLPAKDEYHLRHHQTVGIFYRSLLLPEKKELNKTATLR